MSYEDTSGTIKNRLLRTYGFFKGRDYVSGVHGFLSLAARPVADLVSLARMEYAYRAVGRSTPPDQIFSHVKSFAASTLMSSLFIVPAVVGRKILTGDVQAPDAVKEFLSHFNLTKDYTGPYGHDHDAGLITYAILATILGALACHWAAEMTRRKSSTTNNDGNDNEDEEEDEDEDSSLNKSGVFVHVSTIIDGGRGTETSVLEAERLREGEEEENQLPPTLSFRTDGA